MADSDEEYVNELSDGDQIYDQGQSSNYATRTSGRSKVAQSGRTKERWEDIQRSWDLVTEGADGSLAETVEGLLEAGKRKRLLRDTTPLQRGIIRHVILILDLSISMAEKDLRPTRHLLTLRHTATFVQEFFEQNPISQLGILGMREGVCIRVSDMSGNPNDHINALQQLRTKEPMGSPSLQNALEMARGALFHTPSHGTREVLIIFGALLSSDPGDIHKTIRLLVSDAIRVSVVGLAARIAICTELVAKTNGLGGANSEAMNRYYGVAMHEQHFRDLLLAHTTPPPVHHSTTSSSSAFTSSATPSLLTMGFPSRIEEDTATFCLCHSKPSRGGYLCSRCQAKVCSLPAQCPVCDLQLIQSTHLARSYHHLFPLRNYEEVSWNAARQKVRDASLHSKANIGIDGSQCFACLAPFPPLPDEQDAAGNAAGARGTESQQRQSNGPARRPLHPSPAAKKKKRTQKGASESSRYACVTCGQHFCIDCDVFAHEVSHNCAGCLCAPQPPPLPPPQQANGQEEVAGAGTGDMGSSSGRGGKGKGKAIETPGESDANGQNGAAVRSGHGFGGDEDVEMD